MSEVSLYGDDGKPDLDKIKKTLDFYGFPAVGRVKSVAEATGYSTASVSRFLSGKKEIPAEFVVRLQSVFLKYELKSPLLDKKFLLNLCGVDADAALEQAIKAKESYREDTDEIRQLDLLIYRRHGGIKADIWEIIEALYDDEAMELLKYLRAQKFRAIPDGVGWTGDKKKPDTP